MFAYWLYRSRALVKPRSQADGLVYLQARTLNRALQVTGYLHRDDSHYVQYVEGPVASLKKLHQRIQRDGRHSDIETLLEGVTPKRRFPSWDMAFTDEEIASFAAFQRDRGQSTDLAHAPAQDLLAFMEDAARDGHAGPAPVTRMPTFGR